MFLAVTYWAVGTPGPELAALLGAAVPAGDVLDRNDVTRLLPLLDKVPTEAGVVGRPGRRPDMLFADRGHDHDRYRRLLWQRGIRRSPDAAAVRDEAGGEAEEGLVDGRRRSPLPPAQVGMPDTVLLFQDSP